MEQSYLLGKALMGRLDPSHAESFEIVWKATSSKDDILPTKETALPLTGAEIAASVAFPIVVAITSRLLIDALARIAESRKRRGFKLSIEKQAINLSYPYGIPKKKARQIVRSILEILDEDPDFATKSRKSRNSK